MDIVTQLPRQVREIENIFITLSDGCRLAARIWLPSDAEKNPVPAILSALGIGIAIGIAIRYASAPERKTEIEVKSPLGNLNWSVLSLPFLWPFFKSAREKYESSAEAMKDGIDRLKKIDVNRYAKPIRKRWKAWTR